MKVLPPSYKPRLNLRVARMTTKKGVKWCTLALNALRLKYKTEFFWPSHGEVFVLMGAYAKKAVRTASDSYSGYFNMNLLD